VLLMLVLTMLLVLILRPVMPVGAIIEKQRHFALVHKAGTVVVVFLFLLLLLRPVAHQRRLLNARAIQNNVRSPHRWYNSRKGEPIDRFLMPNAGERVPGPENHPPYFAHEEIRSAGPMAMLIMHPRGVLCS
jgi:hypothetical protein